MRVITTDPETCAALEEAYRDRKPVEFMGKKYVGTSGEFNPGFGAIGPKCSMSMHIVSEPAWVGIGPPPVGTVCEIKIKGISAWCPATILFCRDNALVISWKAEGVAHPTTLDSVEFRPIKTVKQIAAEVRDRAIDELCQAAEERITEEVAALIYDAGYHK